MTSTPYKALPTVATTRSCRKVRPLLVHRQTEFCLPAAPVSCLGIPEAVGDAKLTARQTVEVVCKKLVAAEIHKRDRYVKLLLTAGLHVAFRGDAKPRLMLLDRAKFEMIFPDLKHAVPLLESWAKSYPSSLLRF